MNVQYATIKIETLENKIAFYLSRKRHAEVIALLSFARDSGIHVDINSKRLQSQVTLYSNRLRGAVK